MVDPADDLCHRGLSLAIGLCYTLFEKEMLNLLGEDDYHD